MTIDLDATADAVDAAVTALTAHKDTYVFEEELIAAGHFVARFGTFGDLFDEPDLTRAQLWVGSMNAAWSFLGHWSVSRSDPRPQPDANFEWHRRQCQVCQYLEDALYLRATFEKCPTCSLGLDTHDVAPDGFGRPRVWCRSRWVRCEPRVSSRGDVAAYQDSDAYYARWVANLEGGMFALVIRTYYLAWLDGQTVVERFDEYLLSRDPANPAVTEGAESVCVRVESDNPAGEDPRLLAEQSFAPEPGEWAANAPAGSPPLLAVAVA